MFNEIIFPWNFSFYYCWIEFENKIVKCLIELTVGFNFLQHNSQYILLLFWVFCKLYCIGTEDYCIKFQKSISKLKNSWKKIKLILQNFMKFSCDFNWNISEI